MMETALPLGFSKGRMYTGEGKGGPNPQRDLIYFVDIDPSY